MKESPDFISPNTIIVIGRQMGCGARAVGQRLASHFGLRYFDKELLSEVASKYGFEPSVFLNSDEKRPSLFRSWIGSSFGVADQHTASMAPEAMYNAQAEVIRQLASESGAVFVGRSADYVLRHHPEMISVFLHADPVKRADIIVKRGDASDKEKALNLLKKIDSQRKDFYNYFTGRRWGHADNYHLTLDTSLLSEDNLFNLLKNYITLRFNS